MAFWKGVVSTTACTGRLAVVCGVGVRVIGRFSAGTFTWGLCAMEEGVRSVATRSVVPYPGWCGQTCRRGKGQNVSERRELEQVGRRLAGLTGASRARAGRSAWCECHRVRITGLTLSTGCAWALCAALRSTVSSEMLYYTTY